MLSESENVSKHSHSQFSKTTRRRGKKDIQGCERKENVLEIVYVCRESEELRVGCLSV